MRKTAPCFRASAYELLFLKAYTALCSQAWRKDARSSLAGRYDLSLQQKAWPEHGFDVHEKAYQYIQADSRIAHDPFLHTGLLILWKTSLASFCHVSKNGCKKARKSLKLLGFSRWYLFWFSLMVDGTGLEPVLRVSSPVFACFAVLFCAGIAALRAV